MPACQAVPPELSGVFDAVLLAALCEPARIDVLRVLVTRGRTDLQTIAADLPQDRSVISRHLGLLHQAGVVRREKVGRQMFFELDGPRLLDRLDRMVRGCRTVFGNCCPPTPTAKPRRTPARGSAAKTTRRRP